MFKNIIFDWSGVIKDADESHVWIINKMFEKAGLPAISLEEMKEKWEQPYILFYQKYLPGLTLEAEQKLYYAAAACEGRPDGSAYPGYAGQI